MAKFRKKPIVIEAEQWFPGVEIDGVDESGAAQDAHGTRYDQAVLFTLEGPMIVSPGDWIITGVAGEKYPCKPDIFEQTYDPVEERPCDRCAGCGKIANDEDGTPWKYWEELPVKSAAAVMFGLVKPLVCPACSGSGLVEVDDG